MIKAFWSKLSIPLIAISLVVVMGLYTRHLSGKVEAQAATITAYRASLDDARASLEVTRVALEKVAEDIKTSHKENVRVLETLEKRITDNIQTTGELKNELVKTAADRADCRLPLPVMQLVTEARDRAAAAASCGLDAGLPGTGEDGR